MNSRPALAFSPPQFFVPAKLARRLKFILSIAKLQSIDKKLYDATLFCTLEAY